MTREIAQNAKSCSKRKKLPSNLWKALATPAGKIGFFRVGPARKSYLFATNKSFTDQACSVKMAEKWPRNLCFSIDLDFVGGQ